MSARTEQRHGGNGAAPASDPAPVEFAEAIAYEQSIADEAEKIRKDATELTPALFMELYSLLCKPIPPAYIQTVPATQGKPYDSTGIRSVQVQIDRMNAVLTPLWWWDHTAYEHDGKLATVSVYVGNRRQGEEPDQILLSRTSRGGVERGSGTGNLFKGSYTNAAKLAFARIGVGHEVYVGATDLDPDVDRQLAEQAKGGGDDPAVIGKDIAKKMVDRVWEVAAAKRQLQLAVSHVTEADIGDVSTKAKATAALAKLTFSQAERVDNWINRKADEDQSGAQDE